MKTIKDRQILMAADFAGNLSKAFHAVNGYALRRMARFLNRKSQRHYRLKSADSYYGELAHYGLHRLA